MSNVDIYRKRAAECQRQADAAVSDSVRETLQEVADKYLALAANEERSVAMSSSATHGKGTRRPSPDARG
jgi:outer membrane protein TolC